MIKHRIFTKNNCFYGLPTKKQSKIYQSVLTRHGISFRTQETLKQSPLIIWGLRSWKVQKTICMRGQIIKYIVTPVMGLPLRWVTEITHVEDQKYFVDEQRFGPYSLWHHKHFIKDIPGGVEMIDIVDYKLPLGVLGRIAHPLFVKRQLNQIFNYRYNKLVELFGEFRD